MIAGCLLAVAAVVPCPTDGFVAFSLREADRLAASGSDDPTLLGLGGITRVVGMVHADGDVILVGRRLPGPPATLEDLVLALRARLVLGQWPKLSLEAGEAPDQLDVVTAGGIRGTTWHADFLTSDLFLKALAMSAARVDGTRAHVDWLLESHLAELQAAGLRATTPGWTESAPGGAPAGARGHPLVGAALSRTKFWFAVWTPARFVVREGVFCIDELRLCVEVQQQTSAPFASDDQAGARFAADLTREMPKLLRSRPDLQRLKVVYDLVAVAEGIRSMQARPVLDHLLHGFEVAPVDCAVRHPARSLTAVLDLDSGGRRLLQVSGGVELRAELAWLNGGDVGVLRGIVLGARPGARSLTWDLPLDGWLMPNAQDLALQSPVREPGVAPGVAPGHAVTITTVNLSAPRTGWMGPRFTDFGSVSTPPLRPGGVSMRMVLAEDAFQRDTSGWLLELRGAVAASQGRGAPVAWRLGGAR